MLDLSFFGNPRFSAAGAAVTLVNFAFVGTLFLLTQFLQFVLGYTPLQAGIRMLPAVIGIMVTAPLSARLVARFGTKIVVVTGMATVTTGSGYPLAATALALFGIGAGLVSAPAAESMLGAVPKAKARAKPHPPELPPMCDPALHPSCARPLVGLSFPGHRPQLSSSEHNTHG